MTEETPKDYEQDELITIKLSRKDVEIVKKIIDRERAYTWFYKQITSLWIWTVGAGILTLLYLYNEAKLALNSGVH